MYGQAFGAPAGTLQNEMTVSSSSLATDGQETRKMTKHRRRFSLQVPVNFINKMGRKLSVGSQKSGGTFSSHSSSGSSSLNNLSEQYLVDEEPSQTGRTGRSRWRNNTGRQAVSASAHGSEEELNRRFADFDTYFHAETDGRLAERSDRPRPAVPVPIILLQSADEDEDDNRQEPAGRQRSRSETRPASQFSRFLKFNRRRTSKSENPSPTSVCQSIEFPMPYERRGSFQSSSTLSVTTPSILKCSLEQLPEGVQVHHATRTCSPSPDVERSLNEKATYHSSSSDHLSTTSLDEAVPVKFRDRSATFSSSDGPERRHRSPPFKSSSAFLGIPVQRERSVSLSSTQDGGLLLPVSLHPTHLSADSSNDRANKKRRSLGYLFWPPFGRSRYITFNLSFSCIFLK